MRILHVAAFAALLSLATGAGAQPPGPQVDFFLHGHEDDWQLFLSPAAFAAQRAGHRLVFVYATAGDDGKGAAYWQDREAAALASQSLLAKGPLVTGNFQCAEETVAKRPIHRCGDGATSAYFLRVPDGNLSGQGFAADHYQSLQTLRQCPPGQSCAVTTVDGSTTYGTWGDFRAELAAIVSREISLAGAVAATFHAPDIDPSYNPDDHSDHLSIGIAVSQLTPLPAMGWNLVSYVDYASTKEPVNVDQATFAIKTSTYLAYDSAMMRSWGQSPLHDGDYLKYTSWLYRYYSRAGSGCLATCQTAAALCESTCKCGVSSNSCTGNPDGSLTTSCSCFQCPSSKP